jgi:hypothetical protein
MLEAISTPFVLGPDELGDTKWIQIADFPNYWIGDDARVINMKTMKLIRPAATGHGVLGQVRLSINNRVQERSVYQLWKKYHDEVQLRSN